MKTKYQRLNKMQRKEARKAFYKTSNGGYIRSKLRTSLICAICCLIFSLYLLIEAIVKSLGIWQYIYAISLIIFAIFFIISYFIIRAKKVNMYVIKNNIKF